MLLLQALPLLALVVLLASGRVAPPVACAAALVLSLPAAGLHVGALSALPGFAVRALADGAWLAVVPVGIITGGLVFHAAVSLRGVGAGTGLAGAGGLFTTAFFLGPFTEAVTGFGVGTVFSIGALREAGVAGAPAAAIGLLAQMLVPWGGLGPGTAVGAALAGVDAQTMAMRNAMMLAPTLLLLLPLFWWWCARAGVRVAVAERVRQVTWVVGIGALLVVFHLVLPWQICGALAVGPLLGARLLLADPPRDAQHWERAARAAAPYVLLLALLLGLRLWPDPPALRPFADLPSLPLTHAMTALWLAALIMTGLSGHGPRFVARALTKARRPALALLMFVVLARVLSDAGVPVALAEGLVAGFGAAAPFASPLLAAAAGFFAGTNVGSNSAMMPLQSALGRAAGLGVLVLPALQNGTLALMVSPQLTSVASSLAGDGATPGRIWRLTWPVALIALLVGTVSIVVG